MLCRRGNGVSGLIAGSFNVAWMVCILLSSINACSCHSRMFWGASAVSVSSAVSSHVGICIPPVLAAVLQMELLLSIYKAGWSFFDSHLNRWGWQSGGSAMPPSWHGEVHCVPVLTPASLVVSFKLLMEGNDTCALLSIEWTDHYCIYAYISPVGVLHKPSVACASLMARSLASSHW
jgi:hypothetical protein